MDSKIAVLMIGCSLFALTSAAAEWDYDQNGPDTWGQNYPDCNKKSQSPINIVTSAVEIDYDLPIVNRTHFYNPPKKMTLANNGHSIVVNYGESDYVINDKKLLPFSAKIVQYHLHWGASSSIMGSEHKVDNKQYFGELHAVHMNTNYPDISVAMTKSDGLAVFGWFIDVNYPQTNQDMKHFLDIMVQSVANKSEKGFSATFSLETLIPADLDVYYRYSGSLTTPGCFESVVWTVFKQPIEITEEQADMLGKNFFSTTNGTDPINNNYRPVQLLNGRKVTKPAPLVQKSGASLARSSSAVALVACAILVHLF